MVESSIAGALEDVAPRNAPRLRVTPFVVVLDSRPEVRVSEEVQHAFWQDPFSLKPVKKGVLLSSGFKEVDGYDCPYGIVWGMTARVLRNFLSIVKS